MGDLATDTAVEGRDGHYRGRLSEDWSIWGPNGGYVAAVALRAAGAASTFTRPVSLSCHYLSVAEFDAVDVQVDVVRRSRRAESLRVTMTQGARPVLQAIVWTAAPGDGLTHRWAPIPDVPPPEALPSLEARLAAVGEQPRFEFWRNIDERPCGWLDDWANREPDEPVMRAWCRFRPRATSEDPFVDAARVVIVADTFMWPAATLAYTGEELPFIAPSLDLSVWFHAVDAAEEWLLTEARAPVAGDGLVGGTTQVWSRSGSLLASGGQQMLCRSV